MQVTLVDYTENAEQKIATYSALCYGAKTDEESNERRIAHLLKLGHLSTLRFASATFLIGNISRACSHQLVRHKFLDYLQESQRYVEQDKIRFINPFQHATKEHAEFQKSVIDSLISYKRLRGMGVAKEDARLVLPQASPTKLYVAGNFQAWKDFLSLRQSKKAQWELREVANLIAIELHNIAPTIFKEEYETAWKTENMPS